mgnify:CR=1 FL=1
MLLAISCWFATISETVAQSAALDQLIDTLENDNVLHTRFEYTTIDSFTGDTTGNSGELWLTTDSYKVRTTNSLLLVDGETSRVYDKMKERLIISKYNPEEDDFAPSQLLIEVETVYNQIQEQQNGNTIIVTMSSDDIYATFKSVTIMMNSEAVPQQIEAVDQADNQIYTTFLDAHIIERNPTVFTINYPQETKIIDLRQ